MIHEMYNYEGNINIENQILVKCKKVYESLTNEQKDEAGFLKLLGNASKNYEMVI